MATAYGGIIGAFNATPNTFGTNDTNVGRLTEITSDSTPVVMTTAVPKTFLTLPVLTQGTYIIFIRMKVIIGSATTYQRVCWIGDSLDGQSVNISYITDKYEESGGGDDYMNTFRTVVVPDGSTAQYYATAKINFGVSTCSVSGIYQITQIA